MVCQSVNTNPQEQASLMFILNPSLDAQALADEFARHNRISIANFLDEKSAILLHQNLRSRTDWLEIFNDGDRLTELNRAVQLSMTDGQKAALAEAIYANARDGFQYRYETIRVPDDENARSAMDDIMAQFVTWLSSGEALAFLQKVTGKADIQFADGQATAYSPGHFLTGHDDDFPGKHRRAAYILGLTPVWRTEWGGLLLFHGVQPDEAAALTPGFNRLNLFGVPQLHSVTEVTRAAAYRRYSVTGWLRGGNNFDE